MKHEIDLKDYDLRTDMIIDNNFSIKTNKYKINGLNVEEIDINNTLSKKLNKKKGKYLTLSFNDVTDKDNYKQVEKAFIKCLDLFLNKLKLKNKNNILIIGLGNNDVTPDSLGPKVIDNILVTRYLYLLDVVGKGYKMTSAIKPSVTGVTGIETSNLIKSVINVVKPDYIIVVDALKSNSINRVNKTIQITNSGINPGSGIGNNRKEISKETIGIPVIAIGVPTVIDGVTILYDTLINNDKVFSLFEGYNKDNFKELMDPYDNLIVTPKEIDFIMQKLSVLIGNSINKVLHESYTQKSAKN